jgi:hypothetical protein
MFTWAGYIVMPKKGLLHLETALAGEAKIESQPS